MHFQAMLRWWQIKFVGHSIVTFAENGFVSVVISFWYIRKFSATKKTRELSLTFFYRTSIFVFKDVKSYLTSISFIKPSFLLLDVLFYAEIRHAYHKVEKGNHALHFYLAILFCKRLNLDEPCSSSLTSLFHLV